VLAKGKLIKYFVYKDNYRWRSCFYIKKNIKKIKAILFKIKTKRYTVNKVKVYIIKEVKNSLKNNAFNNKNKKAFTINLRLLDRKLSLLK
jgi:hypothetical protein